MKIYWHSTAPFGPSSYSVLTKRTVPDIVRFGHEVRVGTWYGLQGEPQGWAIKPRGEPDAAPLQVVTVLPSVDQRTYGCDTFLEAYREFRADLAITCMDVWALPKEMTRLIHFAPWVPIDHDPCPQPVLDSLSSATYIMSFSRWGVEVLKRAGVEAAYVPCSADAGRFKPMEKELARQKLGLPPDVFLVSMVAANKDSADRKGFGEGLAGFARFAEKHEDARIYIHTNWRGAINIGALLDRLNVERLAVKPDQLAILHGTFNDEYMRCVYCASDVLLNPAKSEGFGLPILEAQMCGCPVAASDFSTTAELLWSGWKIQGQPDWSFGADSWRLRVYVDSVADCLDEAYRNRGSELLRQQARAGAVALDTRQVAETYWAPALKELEALVERLNHERHNHERHKQANFTNQEAGQ
jgi:glycosyltransferase involved in cell wall biosynthesis